MFRRPRTSARGPFGKETRISSIRNLCFPRSIGNQSGRTASDRLLLEARAVTKSYPGVKALSGVDLSVDAGEVHALLGENGAGKSTLMKIIAGSVTPDAGSMTLRGRPVAFGSRLAAIEAGIGIVYQDLSLVPQLTIGENLVLGRWPRGRLGTVDWTRMQSTARKPLNRIGFDVDPRTRVDRLG